LDCIRLGPYRRVVPLLAVLAGFATGISLIVAIGAQNAYLLRLSVRAARRTLVAAVAICAGSDAVLIVAGVLGIGVVVERLPAALLVARIVGAGFLIVYGCFAARRAIRPFGAALVAAPEPPGDDTGLDAPARHPGAVLAAPPRTTAPARNALLVMVAFTWANPHVYLDTLLFLGSVANQQGPALRWWWVLGAITASGVWFSAIGFGGRLLRPVLSRPVVWRVLDGVIAVLMVVLGVSLLLGA
jgi:L-lysine exporter family protein LysE/ArgO